MSTINGVSTTTSPIIYNELINTILQEPLDITMFNKFRQGVYSTLNSLSILTGIATLSSGKALINNAITKKYCSATSKVFLTPQDGNTSGIIYPTCSSGSFTITSKNGSDFGVIAWLLIP